jgi:hypothetical protein
MGAYDSGGAAAAIGVLSIGNTGGRVVTP